MFKLKQRNHQPESKINYGIAKRVLPKFQWYLMALILASPIIFFAGQFLYDNFYPHAQGIVTSEEYVLNAPDDSYVTKINITQGQEVESNFSILKLKSPSLESQINQITKQINDLNRQKTDYTNPEMPTLLRLKKQVLSQIKNNQRYYDYLLSFRESGAVSLLQLRDAQNQLANSQAQYTMIMARISQSEEDFDINKIQVFDNSIRKLQLELTTLITEQQNLNIVAPTSGVIKEIPVHVGEFVAKDKTLAIISSHNQFRILGFIEAKYVNRVHLGHTVHLILPNRKLSTAKVISPPRFTDKLYKGIDLISDNSEKRMVVLLEPAADFPKQYRVNGVEVEVLF